MKLPIYQDDEHAIRLGKGRQLVPRFDQFGYHLSVFLQEYHDEPVVDDAIDHAAIEFDSSGWTALVIGGSFFGSPEVGYWIGAGCHN